MRAKKEIVLSRLDGGLGFDPSMADRLLVDSPRVRWACNMTPTGTGGVRARNGMQFATGSPTLTGSRLAALDSATPQIVDSAANAISATLLSTGVRASIKGGYGLTFGIEAWVQAPANGGQGPLYMMNGNNVPFQWTGSGNIAAWTATAGSVPNGRLMAQTGNRIWVSGEIANPSRVYWSSLGTTGETDARNWDSTAPNDGGFVDLHPGDGQRVTALVPFGPYLMVFKERKIFLFYDPAGGGLNRLVSDVYGAAGFTVNALWAPGLVCATPYGVVFFSSAADELSTDQRYRAYITDGTSVRPLGPLPLAPSFRQGGAGVPHAIYFDDRLYVGPLSLPVGPSQYVSASFYEFHFETDSWWGHAIADQTVTGATEYPYDMVIARDPSIIGSHGLYGNGSTSNKLYRMFSGRFAIDGADNFKYDYAPAWLSLGSRTHQKTVQAILVESNSSGATQLDLETLRDGAANSSSSAQAFRTVGPNSPDILLRCETPEPALRLLGLRVFGQATGGSPSRAAIHSIAVEYDPRAD